MRIAGNTGAGGYGVISTEGSAVSREQDVKDAKYMDQVERGEKVNLFREIGNSVSVELSAEGLAELQKKLSEMENNPGLPILSREEKEKLLQESLKPAVRRHRIIPNIQTNDKLTKGLAGAQEKTVDAAYAIIERNLLPHNVGSLTQQERQELILAGLEQAEYLARSLDQEKAELFMEAMETIAKYGVNGTVDGEGNVTYDIRWGALVGAPDDYISTGDFMKRIAPEKYEEYSAMMTEGLEKNDQKLQLKAVRFLMDWEIQARREDPGAFRAEMEKQVNWKKAVDDTRLEQTFADTDHGSFQTFVDSILEQSRFLDRDFLEQNLLAFGEIINS